MKAKVKNERKRKRAYTITATLFFAAMILAIFGIELYRHTIIDPLMLLPIVALGVAAGFIFLWKLSVSCMSKFWAAFNCSMTGGAILYFLFLFVNSHFADPRLVKADFEILDYGTLAGKSRAPFFYIDFNGIKKELVFKRVNFDHPLESYRKVSLEYEMGLFGFEYIVNKRAETTGESL